VVFQTRVWEPHDTTDDADQVNQERVDLVRALRDALGERFVGGLVPTPFAAKNFPDAVTPHDASRAGYVQMSKRSLVGVYSRGLHHSLAFKLAEYLAASKCVVSTPFRNELPAPLVEGTNYLEFDGIEQCVAQCRRLLADADLAAEMRRRNREYFLREVEPASHMRRCLDRAFDTTSSDGTIAEPSMARVFNPCERCAEN
jgi:hypothetical protein